MGGKRVNTWIQSYCKPGQADESIAHRSSACNQRCNLAFLVLSVVLRTMFYAVVSDMICCTQQPYECI